jgi:uncharacterized protein
MVDVTAQLLKVFTVEKQLRGLRSRLTGAEKFLQDKSRGLSQIETQKAGLEGEIKRLQATAANFEGETKSIDARMEKLREQMNNATSNKEYKAFLTELNTFKADRDKAETSALEVMNKIDELKKQLADLSGRQAEGEQLKKVASSERDARHQEIATRLNELTNERYALAKDVPADVMRDFQRLLDQRGEDAMGAIEIVDLKRHEFHCGVCMMALPIDHVVGLIKGGKLTRCTSCQCILYIEEESKKALQPAGSKR